MRISGRAPFLPFGRAARCRNRHIGWVAFCGFFRGRGRRRFGVRRQRRHLATLAPSSSTGRFLVVLEVWVLGLVFQTQFRSLVSVGLFLLFSHITLRE